MKVTTPAALEFACHSKACAPPPAGKGGSSKSGRITKDSDVIAPGKMVASNKAKPGKRDLVDSKGRVVGRKTLSGGFKIQGIDGKVIRTSRRLGRSGADGVVKTIQEINKKGWAAVHAERSAREFD